MENKVTVIPLVIGTFGEISKELVAELENYEIRGRVETIQTITMMRSDRILKRVLET